jgi:isopentenyl-diphosphate Delta-isomerase
MQDKVILVDENDNVLGYEDKIKAHLGEGKLHRAFSIFIFNNKGELLIQKRASNKMLWPGFWANTCCSHPRKGESYSQAAQRRLKEEMGIRTKPSLMFKFQYQVKYKNIGSENELCAVLKGQYQGDAIKVDPKEVANWKWVKINDLKKDMQSNPQKYAPWFKIEITRIKEIF